MKSNENVDITNLNRSRVPKIVDEEPLTPRKMIKNKENIDTSLTEKMSALQTKIARLEKMTPKRSATPNKKPREYPQQQYEPYQSAVVLFEKEEPKQEISTSQVSVITERESEILSRVSLGRLVE